jgi:hypothetical protein
MDDHQKARLAEWIKGWTEELDRDAIALWHILYGLEDFGGLVDTGLHEGLRLGIQSLLEAGAVPVQGCAQLQTWVRVDYRGSPAEIASEIAGAVAAGRIKPEFPEGLWFAIPDPDLVSASVVLPKPA